MVLVFLVLQGLVTGHGATRLLYEYRLGLWRFLPFLLVIAYYVLASMWPPPGLTRTIHATPEQWHNAARYAVQVLGFGGVIEGLLLLLKRKP